MKLDSEKLYEKFKRIYDESVIRNADKHREEPIEKNRVLKGRWFPYGRYKKNRCSAKKTCNYSDKWI